MFEDLLYIKLAIVISVGIACILIFLSFRNIKSLIPEENREYMDPLPPLLKLLWPLVNLVAHYIGERLSVDYLVKINTDLKRSAIDYIFTAEQFFALRLISSVLMALATYFCLAMLEINDWLYVTIGALVGLILPSLSLSDRRKAREKEIIKSLPTFLDFLVMAIQAGMNFSGAMAQAVDKGPEGAIKVEFQRVLRDIKAGMSRTESLRLMSERLDIRDITAFVTAVVQSEKTGSSVGESLKIQADQRRTERFQRAEKAAMQAPVKLIFPLVAFIFPLTFVILGFPIVMKFMYDM
tara:strand:+ start:9615 stop:10499 length:885 start_codon:yes stop_codon:yes gene_type:complete